MSGSTRPTSDVTAVVWDFGNVLIRWDPYLAVRDILTQAQWEDFRRRSGFDELNRRCDAGLTRADGVAELELLDPWLAQVYAHYARNMGASLAGAVPGTAELVRALDERGVPQYGLTNWPAEDFHHAERHIAVLPVLAGVVASGREGVAKPDPAIYRILVDRFGLEPADTLFVDDSAPNVQAALDLGFRAVRFRDAAQLAAEFVRLGLLPGP
ncbi:MAG: HAD family phosphatase [Actinobacteria bacterium]|nr:HAD family phosphatase [Actinomycetota bacterium]